MSNSIHIKTFRGDIDEMIALTSEQEAALAAVGIVGRHVKARALDIMRRLHKTPIKERKLRTDLEARESAMAGTLGVLRITAFEVVFGREPMQDEMRWGADSLYTHLSRALKERGVLPLAADDMMGDLLKEAA